MLPLVDTHAHLDEIEDLKEALKEARDEGVGGVIAVGMDKSSNEKTLSIAEGEGMVYPALGYHPWSIKRGEIEDNLTFIEENIQRCQAVGEVGLDYKARVKKDLQKEVFADLIKIALRHRKPLILHCRYSHKRVFEMITEEGVKTAVFHWYTGPLDLLKEIVKAGYYISATPALLYSPPHQEAIKEVPLEHLLLETDTPVKYQGLYARPKDVRISLKEVARLKGLPPEKVREETTKNAIRLFGLRGLTFGEEIK